MELIFWTLIIAVILIAFIFFYYFNRFALLSNRIDNSLSQIDVQLKRRADLIPNLIETVKGYAKHEKTIIASVNAARKALVGAKDLPSRVKANDKLEGVLGRLFALAENYPDLKANTNFIELQKELATTEDRVAYARQSYNDSILDYNNLCTTFPGTFFAGLYGRQKKDYLQITTKEREVVKVDFE